MKINILPQNVGKIGISHGKKVELYVEDKNKPARLEKSDNILKVLKARLKRNKRLPSQTGKFSSKKQKCFPIFSIIYKK